MATKVYCDVCGAEISGEVFYVTDAEKEDLCKRCHDTLQAVVKWAKTVGVAVIDVLNNWMKDVKGVKVQTRK